VITVRKLKVTKGLQHDMVLENINLHVNKGEFVAILGASGSGKTTLLRCLSLKDSWDEGEITFKGETLTHLSIIGKYKVRKQCAYLSQQPELNQNRTAAKNVLSGRFRTSALWRVITGLVSRNEHFTAYDYLDRVGLLDKAKIKAGSLSGGEKQRVAIGRALAWGAEVIYADEPISGLDPQSAARVMEDLQRLCQDNKLTVICCIHNVDLAEKYCSRMMGLSDGKIQFDISGRRLTTNEKNLIF
jgi:phosphonate transport system ATP-binding protein